MRRAFFFDQSRCMACNACTVACKDWNQVNPGPVRWRTQYTYEKVVSGTPVFGSLSMSCNHCEEPACMPACAAAAITKRDDGVVIVDREKCVGLQACIQKCPFATPKISNDRQEPNKKQSWQIMHPMQKCDFCASSRTANNEQPVCVSACGCHALDSGDYDALKLKYPDAVQLNKNDFPGAYADGHEYIDTKPMLLIRKRRTQIIS